MDPEMSFIDDFTARLPSSLLSEADYYAIGTHLRFDRMDVRGVGISWKPDYY